jgi:ectoine hydroxylase-related dioxygenase (phytanoyl-CoA dioxygenase family)
MEAKKRLEEYIFEILVYGFCIIENVLDDATVYTLREKIDLLMSPTEKAIIKVSNDGAGQIDNQKKLLNLPTRDPIFFQLIDHPSVLPIVEKILGNEVILASLNGRVVTNEMPEQKLHSDIPYQLWNRDKEIMLNVLWMIDDFEENNGSTVILPMSHKSHLPAPPNGKEIKYLKKVIAPAGSIMIFNGSCWHGSSKNETTQPRRAIFSQYRVGFWMRFQCDPHEGFTNHWFSLLNQKQKELMRMTGGIGSNYNADMK